MAVRSFENPPDPVFFNPSVSDSAIENEALSGRKTTATSLELTPMKNRHDPRGCLPKHAQTFE
jgi:hypothetical protein